MLSLDHVHHVPRHIVAVSAFVTNQQWHVLLVKTHRRSDTWELPGGQVEEGEPLDKAVVRECLEETNVTIQPKGITGVYYNAASHILTVVFYGEYVSGTIQIQPEENPRSQICSVARIKHRRVHHTTSFSIPNA